MPLWPVGEVGGPVCAGRGALAVEQGAALSADAAPDAESGGPMKAAARENMFGTRLNHFFVMLLTALTTDITMNQ